MVVRRALPGPLRQKDLHDVPNFRFASKADLSSSGAIVPSNGATGSLCGGTPEEGEVLTVESRKNAFKSTRQRTKTGVKLDACVWVSRLPDHRAACRCRVVEFATFGVDVPTCHALRGSTLVGRGPGHPRRR